MRSVNWYNSHVKYAGAAYFDYDTFYFEVDEIKFENVDYDYFSIQVDNDYRANRLPHDYEKYTLDDMHYEDADFEYAVGRKKLAECYEKYIKIMLDEHNI